MTTTQVQIGKFTQYKVGSVRFYTHIEGISLNDMAKELGYDLQERRVLDFEYEFEEICKVATKYNGKYPLIIQKSIFEKR